MVGLAVIKKVSTGCVQRAAGTYLAPGMLIIIIIF